MDTDKVFGLLVIDLFQRGFHPIPQIGIRPLQRFQAFDNHIIEVGYMNPEQLIRQYAACTLAAGDIATVIDRGEGRSVRGGRGLSLVGFLEKRKEKRLIDLIR